MHLEGTTTIKAPRQTVWEFLTDPNRVAQCAPGVETVEIIEPGKKFQATAAIGFGSVKARFKGDAEFVEMDPPNRATIKAHGNAPGSAADVLSAMQLVDAPDGATELKWTADVTVVGQIASLAARMMTPVSQKLTGLFFDEVRKRIETPPAPVPAEPVPAPAPVEAPPPAEAPPAVPPAPAALLAPAADPPPPPAA